MSAGEYIATKTQEQVFDGEIGVERRHVSQYKEQELDELSTYFTKIGIAPSKEESDRKEVMDIHRRLVAFYRVRDDAHLAAQIALEFGVIEEEKRNPMVAGAVAFFLFFIGALPSVIPFLFTDHTNTAFLVAAIFTTLGLLLVGVIKTWATRGSILTAATENLVVSAGGAAIAYGIGFLFEKLIKEDE